MRRIFLYYLRIVIIVPKYIYQNENWTDFTWQNAVVSASLGEVRLMQGRISVLIRSLGFKSKDEKILDVLTTDVLKSSEIEGERLDLKQVRSSVARRLGLETAGLVPSPRNVDGIVEMMLDATQKYQDDLTEKRIFGWHAALFPTGYSGTGRIAVGRYRSEEVRVVSGAIGKEKIHYEAVPAEFVKTEMDKFLSWFNDPEIVIDEVLKSAIAHFWFVTIHPFDDGNGRITRAVSDMLLARSENSSERFYSMSKQILAQRNEYYEKLKRTQQGGNDITEWIVWYLETLKNALKETEDAIQNVMQKALFWEKRYDISINERQRKMINLLFDDFSGHLTSSKWAMITKCSSDTALRDIDDLIHKGILKKDDAGGRSTNYKLIQ